MFRSSALPRSERRSRRRPREVSPAYNDFDDFEDAQARLISIINSLHERIQGLDDDAHTMLDATDALVNVYEDEGNEAAVDDEHKAVGAKEFNQFERQLVDFDKELRNLAHKVQQLGSSVGALSSAYHMRERLADMRHILRENAADLFPIIARQGRPTVTRRSAQHPISWRKKAPSAPLDTPPIVDSLHIDTLPDHLLRLADGLHTFLASLNEFPEFNDETMNASINAFETDLRYWADSLRSYVGQFKESSVQHYVHDISIEMGDHLDAVIASLAYFTQVGVPTIRIGQQHGISNLQNLSAVSTFFSAVTATTLQFSYDKTDGLLAIAVNAFWFSSLVFSIAAAVNSLLGLTWRQSMYRSPRQRVPGWVLMWIQGSPLLFLVVAVGCFSVGLVLFSWSSHQHYAIRVITTVFTGLSTFGLSIISGWFTSERWAYRRHHGHEWLADIIDSFLRRINLPALPRRNRRGNLPPGSSTPSSHEGAGSAMDRTDTRTSIDSGASPTDMRSIFDRSGGSAESLPESRFDSEAESRRSFHLVERPTPGELEAQTSSHILPTSKEPSNSGISHVENLSARPATGRFVQAVRRVMAFTRVVQAARTREISTPSPHLPAQTTLLEKPPPVASTAGTSSSTRSEDQSEMALEASRLAALSTKVKSMEVAQTLPAHQAFVKHLQFSRDGKFLLETSGWGKTSVIFRVGDPSQEWPVLSRAQDFTGPVAWSPTGRVLITPLTYSMKVWNLRGECKQTIERKRRVRTVTWLPKGGKAFLSVEGNEVVELDLNGAILDTYRFDCMELYDIAVTPDSQRLVVIGTFLGRTNAQPSLSRREKRIIVYDMERKQIEHQAPLLQDVQNVTMARNGKVVLVSYGNKAPPQLWALEVHDTDVPARLWLRHTYMPKTAIDSIGPSYFGGKDDELVLCAGKSGDIHVWHRDSAALLHYVPAHAHSGTLTCLAWRNAMEDPLMFATGGLDGAVRIWTTPLPRAPTTPDPNVTEGALEQSTTPMSPGTVAALPELQEVQRPIPDNVLQSPTQDIGLSRLNKADENALRSHNTVTALKTRGPSAARPSLKKAVSFKVPSDNESDGDAESEAEEPSERA